MSTTYLGLQTPADGKNWGNAVNANMQTLDEAYGTLQTQIQNVEALNRQQGFFNVNQQENYVILSTFTVKAGGPLVTVSETDKTAATNLIIVGRLIGEYFKPTNVYTTATSNEIEFTLNGGDWDQGSNIYGVNIDFAAYNVVTGKNDATETYTLRLDFTGFERTNSTIKATATPIVTLQNNTAFYSIAPIRSSNQKQTLDPSDLYIYSQELGDIYQGQLIIKYTEFGWIRFETSKNFTSGIYVPQKKANNSSLIFTRQTIDTSPQQTEMPLNPFYIDGGIFRISGMASKEATAARWKYDSDKKEFIGIVPIQTEIYEEGTGKIIEADDRRQEFSFHFYRQLEGSKREEVFVDYYYTDEKVEGVDVITIHVKANDGLLVKDEDDPTGSTESTESTWLVADVACIYGAPVFEGGSGSIDVTMPNAIVFKGFKSKADIESILTPATGDLWIDQTTGKEYVFLGSYEENTNKPIWEELGKEADLAGLTTSVEELTASVNAIKIGFDEENGQIVLDSPIEQDTFVQVVQEITEDDAESAYPVAAKAVVDIREALEAADSEIIGSTEPVWEEIEVISNPYCIIQDGDGYGISSSTGNDSYNWCVFENKDYNQLRLTLKQGTPKSDGVQLCIFYPSGDTQPFDKSTDSRIIEVPADTKFIFVNYKRTAGIKVEIQRKLDLSTLSKTKISNFNFNIGLSGEITEKYIASGGTYDNLTIKGNGDGAFGRFELPDDAEKVTICGYQYSDAYYCAFFGVDNNQIISYRNQQNNDTVIGDIIITLDKPDGAKYLVVNGRKTQGNARKHLINVSASREVRIEELDTRLQVAQADIEILSTAPYTKIFEIDDFRYNVQESPDEDIRAHIRTEGSAAYYVWTTDKQREIKLLGGELFTLRRDIYNGDIILAKAGMIYRYVKNSRSMALEYVGSIADLTGIRQLNLSVGDIQDSQQSLTLAFGDEEISSVEFSVGSATDADVEVWELVDARVISNHYIYNTGSLSNNNSGVMCAIARIDGYTELRITHSWSVSNQLSYCFVNDQGERIEENTDKWSGGERLVDVPNGATMLYLNSEKSVPIKIYGLKTSNLLQVAEEKANKNVSYTTINSYVGQTTSYVYSAVKNSETGEIDISTKPASGYGCKKINVSKLSGEIYIEGYQVAEDCPLALVIGKDKNCLRTISIGGIGYNAMYPYTLRGDEEEIIINAKKIKTNTVQAYIRQKKIVDLVDLEYRINNLAVPEQTIEVWEAIDTGIVQAGQELTGTLSPNSAGNKNYVIADIRGYSKLKITYSRDSRDGYFGYKLIKVDGSHEDNSKVGTFIDKIIDLSSGEYCTICINSSNATIKIEGLKTYTLTELLVEKANKFGQLVSKKQTASGSGACYYDQDNGKMTSSTLENYGYYVFDLSDLNNTSEEIFIYGCRPTGYQFATVVDGDGKLVDEIEEITIYDSTFVPYTIPTGATKIYVNSRLSNSAPSAKIYVKSDVDVLQLQQSYQSLTKTVNSQSNTIAANKTNISNLQQDFDDLSLGIIQQEDGPWLRLYTEGSKDPTGVPIVQEPLENGTNPVSAGALWNVQQGLQAQISQVSSPINFMGTTNDITSVTGQKPGDVWISVDTGEEYIWVVDKVTGKEDWEVLGGNNLYQTVQEHDLVVSQIANKGNDDSIAWVSLPLYEHYFAISYETGKLLPTLNGQYTKAHRWAVVDISNYVGKTIRITGRKLGYDQHELYFFTKVSGEIIKYSTGEVGVGIYNNYKVVVPDEAVLIYVNSNENVHIKVEVPEPTDLSVIQQKANKTFSLSLACDWNGKVVFTTTGSVRSSDDYNSGMGSSYIPVPVGACKVMLNGCQWTDGINSFESLPYAVFFGGENGDVVLDYISNDSAKNAALGKGMNYMPLSMYVDIPAGTTRIGLNGYFEYANHLGRRGSTAIFYTPMGLEELRQLHNADKAATNESITTIEARTATLEDQLAGIDALLTQVITMQDSYITGGNT